jgi:hypothetical protein
MCQSAIALISNALQNVDNDEKLRKVKSRISLFIQTMDVSVPEVNRYIAKKLGVELYDIFTPIPRDNDIRKVFADPEEQVQRCFSRGRPRNRNDRMLILLGGRGG